MYILRLGFGEAGFSLQGSHAAIWGDWQETIK
jgi:hypothetical protein